MELIKPGTNIPFTSYRKIAVILSTVVNLVVLLALFIKGPNLGVDFSGGTMVHLKFQQRVTIGEIRQALEKANLGGAVIQDFGERDANEYLVRLEKAAVEIGALGDQVTKSLTEQFGAAFRQRAHMSRRRLVTMTDLAFDAHPLPGRLAGDPVHA